MVCRKSKQCLGSSTGGENAGNTVIKFAGFEGFYRKSFSALYRYGILTSVQVYCFGLIMALIKTNSDWLVGQ